MEKFLGYGRQSIDEKDIEAVVAILRGNSLTQGPAVEAFEAEFSRFSGASYTIAVSNGTAALHLAALALDLGPGDAVVVPALTFAATANAVLYTGAVPVFADVEESSLCLDPASVEEAIAFAKKEGLRPRAIFPVHYAGRPARMDEIYRIADSHQLQVVEDCCHALGALTRAEGSKSWRHVGCDRSAFGVFSFHPVKHITTGEGGCLTTHDPSLAKKVARLRSHGITKNSDDFVNPELSMAETATGERLINPWYHEMQELGFNFRLCDVQAALGLSQMSRVASFVEKRRRIADYYRQAFAGHEEDLTLPPGDDAHNFHSYHLFPLQIEFEKIGLTRGEFMKDLHRNGIGSQVHYLPVFWHPFYKNNPQLWRAVSCKNTVSYYQKTLSIPIHPELQDRDIEHVATSILDLLTEK